VQPHRAEQDCHRHQAGERERSQMTRPARLPEILGEQRGWERDQRDHQQEHQVQHQCPAVDRLHVVDPEAPL
jgi:hypothetical protein